MTRLIPLGLVALAVALAGPVRAQDASELIVRLNRVEGQMRQLSGQVEQLQFENKQLKDQLRKFQEDVEFRFQERGGRPSAQPAPRRPPEKRSDAFDPDADPGAPGAPRPLGQPPALPPVASAQPDSRAPRAVVPARPRPAGDEDDEDGPPPGRPLDLGAAGRPSGGAPAPYPPQAPYQPQAPSAALPPPAAGSPQPYGMNPGRPSTAAPASRPAPAAGSASPAGPGSPAAPGPAAGAAPAGSDIRAEYEAAYASLSQRQYDEAEAGFRRFLQAHPRDRLAPDAVYWLGETYLRRNQPREAAEQFLKVSTDYSRSAKAPDAMLKLGVALTALGAREQACATFAELERKYPAASASVKQGADREQKRSRCAA